MNYTNNRKYILMDIFGAANNKIGAVTHVVSCKYIAVDNCFVKYVIYGLVYSLTLSFTLDGCIATQPSSGVHANVPFLVTFLNIKQNLIYISIFINYYYYTRNQTCLITATLGYNPAHTIAFIKTVFLEFLLALTSLGFSEFINFI